MHRCAPLQPGLVRLRFGRYSRFPYRWPLFLDLCEDCPKDLGQRHLPAADHDHDLKFSGNRLRQIEHHRRLGAPHLALRQDKVRVIGCERDANAVRLDRRNIRGLDQRLGRHADEGRASAMAPTARPIRPITPRGADLGRSDWVSFGAMARSNVFAPPLIRTTGARSRRRDAERLAHRGDVLVGLPDDRWHARRTRCAIHPQPLRSATVSILLPIPRSRRKRPT